MILTLFFLTKNTFWFFLSGIFIGVLYFPLSYSPRFRSLRLKMWCLVSVKLSNMIELSTEQTHALGFLLLTLFATFAADDNFLVDIPFALKTGCRAHVWFAIFAFKSAFFLIALYCDITLDFVRKVSTFRWPSKNSFIFFYLHAFDLFNYCR